MRRNGGGIFLSKICYNEEKYRWSSLNSDFDDFINDWQKEDLRCNF